MSIQIVILLTSQLRTNHDQLEVVYYDAINPDKGTTELPDENWDSNQDMLEKNLVYKSSTTAQIDQYDYI